MPTYRRMLLFYLPLMVQACSQALTYPLVAMVVVRGPLGSVAMSAYAQGQTVMFIIGMLGGGLITTGMLYARDRAGYRSFCRLNFYLAGTIAFLQMLVSVPPLDDWIFGGLLRLPDELRAAAELTLLLGIPAYFGFMLRNPYQVTLYNAMASGRANAASVGRIIFTLILAYAWCYFFPTGGGVVAATVVFTVPIYFEVLLSWWLARPFLRTMPATAAAPTATVRQQLSFTLPLTIGGFLLALSEFIIAAFIGRGPHPERMVTIHFIVVGIVNPLGFSGLRMQTVLLSYISHYGAAVKKMVWRFSAATGLALGAVVLVALVPAAADWYFGAVQKLTPLDARLAAVATLCMLPFPLLQALRSYNEGLAAFARRPRLILVGQLMFVVTLFVVLGILSAVAAPGYLMGVIALCAASFAAQVTIWLGLRTQRLEFRV